MSELRECPFCGGKASIFEFDDHGGKWWWHVVCGDDDCPADELVITATTEKRAVAKWNTRASDRITITDTGRAMLKDGE